MIPRVGERIVANQRYILRPGVYCILPRSGHLLLTEEFETQPDIQLPGGGIDPGESPLQALHREVMEETGWTISSPRRLGAFRRFAYLPEYDMWAEKLCAVYVARPCRQVSAPTERYHRTLWVTAQDAVNILGNEGDRLLLQRWMDTRQPE